MARTFINDHTLCGVRAAKAIICQPNHTALKEFIKVASDSTYFKSFLLRFNRYMKYNISN